VRELNSELGVRQLNSVLGVRELNWTCANSNPKLGVRELNALYSSSIQALFRPY
jgi:hypothetical protein